MSNSNNEKLDTNPTLPDTILKEIMKSGMLIVGGRGVGKSTSAKVITTEILKKDPMTQIKILDPTSTWRWNFSDSVRYQSIDESTRFIYDGNKSIIFDVGLIDEYDVMSFIEKIILNDYLRQRDRKEELGGYNDKSIIYVIEEAQSVLGSYSLRRKGGRKMLKMISEGRNYNLAFILIGQRMANISTSALERMQGFLMGKMTGARDLSKIRRVCGRVTGIVDEIPQLNDVGEFIYWNGSSSYRFNCPRYECDTSPIEWKMKPEEIKKWQYLWGRRIL